MGEEVPNGEVSSLGTGLITPADGEVALLPTALVAIKLAREIIATQVISGAELAQLDDQILHVAKELKALHEDMRKLQNPDVPMPEGMSKELPAFVLRVSTLPQRIEKRITTKQAAEILGVCPRTVLNYIRDGHLRNYPLPSGHKRLDLRDVLKLAASRQ